MDTPDSNLRQTLWLAAALSLGAAVSLGVTRFAYGLLLPTMRADLDWNYTTAGAMNTVNALGYLIGALTVPALLKRWSAAQVLLVGALLASVFMGLSGFFVAVAPLLLQRLLAGSASALVFVTGGLLAARLGLRVPGRAGLILGIYYGGVGWGIALSALLVPWVLDAAAQRPHGWAWAWWLLALACLLVCTVLAWPARVLLAQERAGQTDRVTASVTASVAAATRPGRRFAWRDFGFALAGYALFGVGYIGYMTFVIALLREQGLTGAAITLFYTLLGLAVVASARIWARLLDRYHGGQALALLNALLGLATVLPAVTQQWGLVLASGLLFGGVFLSVVASTTALVRHNLPADQWGLGISAFTVVFAAGQIVGPTLVGWIADGHGGLAQGLLLSAVALWLGAALALRQRELPPTRLTPPVPAARQR